MAADETVKDEIAEDMFMVDSRTLDVEYSVAGDGADPSPEELDMQRGTGESR